MIGNDGGEKNNERKANAEFFTAAANARHAPERIGTGKPSWYECKMCKLKEVCYGD